ncbi:MAG TPA: CHASE2 domain-containing protein [Steroidobacteraceae bacterium]
MSPPEEKPADAVRLQKYRETLLEKLVLGLPVGLITAACTALQNRLTSSPWTALWIALPLGVAAWFTWRLLKRPNMARALLVSLVFLTAYGAVFALASVSDLLVWRQVPNDAQGVQLRAWMLPVRAGDWRYAVAQRKPLPADDMLVVIMDPSPGEDGRARTRAREAALIELAMSQQARGVGLDVYFQGQTSSDAALCTTVERARQAGIPVWAGFTNKNLKNGKLPVAVGADALPCFTTAHVGSLRGFADSDGRVRAVRLTWERMGDQPSFSVLGAAAVEKSYGRTLSAKDLDDPVLRYLPPPEEFPVPVTREFDVLTDPGVLHRKLVLIGLNVKEDRYYTPWGVQPGTLIQANAIHSLRVGTRIERPDGFWSALVVAVLCYLIVVLAIDGISTRKLLVVAAGLSIAVIGASALLMYAWLMWFEVIYALVALWLLVPLVVVLRRHPAWQRLAKVDFAAQRNPLN